MVKKDKAVANKNAFLDETKSGSVLEALEALQSLAANGSLADTLAASGIRASAKAAHAAGSKRFSELTPFKREAFDYEDYSAKLAAHLKQKK